MVDLARDIWLDTVRLTVQNFRSVSQSAQISVDEGLPAGTTLTFDQTTFSVAPDGKTTVMAILAVPSSVPILTQEPFAYSGTIQVTSDSDKVGVPFCFLKASKLIVTFDAQASMVTLLDRTKGRIVSDIGTIPEGAVKFSFSVPKEDALEVLALMEQQDTLGVTSYSIVDHNIDNADRITYVPVSSSEASINVIDTVYDILGNKVIPDSIADVAVSLRMSLEEGDFFWALSTGMRSNIFISSLDSSIVIEKDIRETRGTDVFLLRTFARGVRSREDIAIGSGANNLIGYPIGSCSYDDPYPENAPSPLRKEIVAGLSTSWRTPRWGAAWRWSTGVSNVRNLFVNRPSMRQGLLDDSSLYASMYVGIRYWPDQHVILRSPDFSINGNDEAVFELKQTTEKGTSTALLYETVKPGDTIKVEQNAHVNVPDCMAYIRNGSLFIHPNNNWSPLSSSYGGTRQGNGVSEWRDESNPYWMVPLFTARAFAHNRAQSNTKPFLRNQSILYNDFDRQYAYYEFDHLNNSPGTFLVLSDAQPYSLLGQAGQSSAAMEYQIPSTLSDKPVDPSIDLLQASAVFPSFSLLQVAVDGRAVDAVRPDQAGKIRLVLFDPDSSVTSAKLLLLPASGEEIDLPVVNGGGHEYTATIPANVPPGFTDIIARVDDAKGNHCELTASPAFYFGNNTDNRKMEARVRMNAYTLRNVEDVTFVPGDTLKYILSYINYGSDAARNVVVKFPPTPYFRPMDSVSGTIDSLGVNDTVQVPVNLVFLGKQQSTDQQTHYTPSMTWTSGGTPYLRNSRVLVDFQNTETGVAQAEGAAPKTYSLYQNYPNPFNPSTMIMYDVPKATRVKLVVYDVLGREVATLVDDLQMAGRHQSIWNANRLASGVYFSRIQAGEYTATRKLLLVK